jgi:hypothetical protein
MHGERKLAEAGCHDLRGCLWAQQQLRDMARDLLTEGADTGDLRDDVAPDELASYCLHALTAASSLPSKAVVRGATTSETRVASRIPTHAAARLSEELRGSREKTFSLSNGCWRSLWVIRTTRRL